jgi:hypothetical protein
MINEGVQSGLHQALPPLPDPLLHPMEEREKSRSLMQPWSSVSSVHWR